MDCSYAVCVCVCVCVYVDEIRNEYRILVGKRDVII